MIEFNDIIDIEEMKKIFKEDKFKFSLIMLIFAGAFLELVTGKVYSETLLEKELKMWEHVVIVACLVTVRYTCTQAITMDDPIVGTVAVLLSSWYTYTLVSLPVGLSPLVTGLSAVTTAVGIVFWVLMIKGWVYPDDEPEEELQKYVSRKDKKEDETEDKTEEEKKDE